MRSWHKARKYGSLTAAAYGDLNQTHPHICIVTWLHVSDYVKSLHRESNVVRLVHVPEGVTTAMSSKYMLVSKYILLGMNFMFDLTLS